MILGNTRFNDIARGLPGISRSLLTQRLRHLERRGVLLTLPSPTGRGSEYHLTQAGKDLFPVLEAMGRWAVEWLYEEFEDDVEATTLMWWMHRLVDDEQLPPGRVVAQFDHTAPVRTTIWLVLEQGEASVCMQHPGMEPDVVVRASTPTLARIFSGAERWSASVANGDLDVQGPPGLARAIPSWFRWSPWSAEMQARTARAALA